MINHARIDRKKAFANWHSIVKTFLTVGEVVSRSKEKNARLDEVTYSREVILLMNRTSVLVRYWLYCLGKCSKVILL